VQQQERLNYPKEKHGDMLPQEVVVKEPNHSAGKILPTHG
jgi:hypothetical protein